MKWVELNENAPPLDSIRHVALGFFDGLHLGHRSVIINPFSDNALDQTAVLSFWPHPLTILRPQQAPPLLTDFDEKNRILENWTIGRHCWIPFDTQTANRPPEWLMDKLGASFPGLRSLSVGPNFRFGLNRGGSPLTLSQWCQEKNIQFHLTDFILDQGMPISSSRIRQSLAAGDLETGERLLGHPYQLSGTVVTGQKKGRQMGLPTANLSMKKDNILPAGVYAAHCHFPDGTRSSAALNIGQRPTVKTKEKEPTLSIEAHLIDWEGDCYGQHLSVTPLKFIRPEQRFQSIEKLADQIRRDVDTCRTLLESTYKRV